MLKYYIYHLNVTTCPNLYTFNISVICAMAKPSSQGVKSQIILELNVSLGVQIANGQMVLQQSAEGHLKPIHV